MLQPPPPIVLLFGSRHWANKDRVREVFGLHDFPPGTLFIHGDNGYDAQGRMLFDAPDHLAERGADKIAGAVAEEFGYQVRRYPAAWKKHGPAAGPIRNSQMANARPVKALCFGDMGPGSRDMEAKARAVGAKITYWK